MTSLIASAGVLVLLLVLFVLVKRSGRRAERSKQRGKNLAEIDKALDRIRIVDSDVDERKRLRDKFK